MKDQNNQQSKGTPGSRVGIGVALGAVVGAGIGAALNNVALGVAIGVAIGAALGVSLDHSGRGKGEEENRGTENMDATPTTAESLTKWRYLFLIIEGALLLISGFVLWWSPEWVVHQFVAYAYLVTGLGLAIGWTAILRAKGKVGPMEQKSLLHNNLLPYLLPAAFVFIWLVFFISAE